MNISVRLPSPLDGDGHNHPGRRNAVQEARSGRVVATRCARRPLETCLTRDTRAEEVQVSSGECRRDHLVPAALERLKEKRASLAAQSILPYSRNVFPSFQHWRNCFDHGGESLASRRTCRRRPPSGAGAKYTADVGEVHSPSGDGAPQRALLAQKRRTQQQSFARRSLLALTCCTPRKSWRCIPGWCWSDVLRTRASVANTADAGDTNNSAGAGEMKLARRELLARKR